MVRHLMSRSSYPLVTLLVLAVLVSLVPDSRAQDDLDSIVVNPATMPRCFGFTDITEFRALAICDALRLDQNVRARELADQWVRENPESPAAQYALAEVLYSIEGNLPRSLFHLNRAEELTNYNSLEESIASGNIQWHYLTLSQLSYVHQLMGDQIASLEYLDKISTIYGQDIESFRGWPLIKLKEYEAARASANQVLESSNNARERARAWNTLCAVELASLSPIDSMEVCDRAINEDMAIAGQDETNDTVYLTNASEVALSLIEIDEAERYLDRATRSLNPDSVSDPWIYKLFLTLNQSRFDEARQALDNMLVWREQQEPIVNVMNKAEHFLVSASFLLVAGYAEDAAKLTSTALNQPDRNGSYSADDFQKDSFAALVNAMANEALYQQQLERTSTLEFSEAVLARLQAQRFRFNAWLARRRAAPLFARDDVLLNRVRPYAPLEVHIPEWIEPELVGLLGAGLMRAVLEEAREKGAFILNEGYYYSYLAEIDMLEGRYSSVLASGNRALELLPSQESLLRGRILARMAQASEKSDSVADAMNFYERALRHDPSVIRRLGIRLPVQTGHDGTGFAVTASRMLERSPRFIQSNSGLLLEVKSEPELSICLKNQEGAPLSCYTMAPDQSATSQANAQQLVVGFHEQSFGLGFDISQAQRSMLLGGSVIVNAQRNSASRQLRDDFISN